LCAAWQNFADARATDEDAPALKPVVDLYSDLYKMGFSLTFITGRCGQNSMALNTSMSMAIGWELS
jgi:hypothetical protein